MAVVGSIKAGDSKPGTTAFLKPVNLVSNCNTFSRGQVVVPKELVYTQLFEDIFQRPDETPLNPVNWSLPLPDRSALSVVSHLCKAPDTITTSKNAESLCIATTFPANQYSEVTIANLTANGVIEIGARSDATLTPGYFVSFIGDLGTSSCEVGLFSIFDPIGTNFIGTLNIGDIIRLECFSSSIVVKLNGIPIISAIDTVTASGSPVLGLAPFVVVDDAVISRFAAGSIS